MTIGELKAELADIDDNLEVAIGVIDKDGYGNVCNIDSIEDLNDDTILLEVRLNQHAD